MCLALALLAPPAMAECHPVEIVVLVEVCSGVGSMTGMQIPFQSTFGAHILAGQDVMVTPY